MLPVPETLRKIVRAIDASSSQVQRLESGADEQIFVTCSHLSILLLHLFDHFTWIVPLIPLMVLDEIGFA